MITKKTANSGSVNEYYGLSTDTKPTADEPNGSTFHEIDTGNMYMYNEAGGTWVLQTSASGGSGGGSGNANLVVTESDGTLDKNYNEIKTLHCRNNNCNNRSII